MSQGNYYLMIERLVKPLTLIHRCSLNAVVFTLLSGCMVAPQQHVAPAQADFPGIAASEVRARMIARCIDKRFQVDQTTDNVVTCSRQLDGQEAFAANALLGFGNSGLPYMHVQCTIYGIGDVTRGTLTEWVDGQNTFGKNVKYVIDSPKHREQMRAALYEMGGEVLQ